MKPNPEHSGSILIVDDTVENLRLLASLLGEKGYEVRPVTSGRQALQAAERSLPDLVLLDITMPEMDGYEVCRQLKSREHLRDVPVIFLTALTETADKLKAFGVGGVDYISKPFQMDEVLARVRVHTTLKRTQNQLAKNYEQLRELEKLRDNLVHMIVHDMRSPLMAICMGLELMTETSDKETMKRLMQSANSGANALTEMITLLLDTSRLEAGQMPLNRKPQNLAETLRATMDSLAALAGQREVRLDAADSLVLEYDRDIIGRVVANLLTNAFKFTPPTGTVTVAAEQQPGHVRVSITDTGKGIAPEHHQKIFQKFSQAELRHKEVGVGLGLAFCKLAVETHGGQIGVNSQLGHGSSFWFTLPAKEKRGGEL